MQQIIRDIRSHAATVPINLDLSGVRLTTDLSCIVVEIETDDGLIGHGFSCITDEEVVASAIDTLVKPDLIGTDALAREYIAERLYWLMTPRGQTGYAGHAAAAIDLALWDIFGKSVALPCWRLLGAARNKVPLYTTFGFGSMSEEELEEVAKHLVNRGSRRLKMVVGHHALQKRNEGCDLYEILHKDVARVRRVREAIGPDIALYVDANCSLDTASARWLATQITDCDIGFFEEPLRDNDVHALATLRSQVAMPLAAGQNETQPWRYADLIRAGSVDILQPNVVIGGGFTGVGRISGLAAAHNMPIANGGAFPFHNMHIHAGLAQGGLVEWHLAAVELCQVIFDNLPKPSDPTVLTLPETPGLGFELNKEALAECVARPKMGGRAKG